MYIKLIGIKRNSDFILFIISYTIYFFSLEECLDGEELCGNNMRWIYLKITEIISCELIVFLLIKIFFFNSSKFHLIHLFLVFIL